MKEKMIYVNANNTATIVCDSCGKWKTVNVASYVNLNKPVKIRCSCKAVFSVSFEKRKFYRKQVDLYGTYSMQDKVDVPIFIKDISFGGFGFKINRGTVENGDTLSVEFVLDDKARSKISEDVIVRNVKDRFIGVEFVSPSEHTKKVLGFYLLP